MFIVTEYAALKQTDYFQSFILYSDLAVLYALFTSVRCFHGA